MERSEWFGAFLHIHFSSLLLVWSSFFLDCLDMAIFSPRLSAWFRHGNFYVFCFRFVILRLDWYHPLLNFFFSWLRLSICCLPSFSFFSPQFLLFPLNGLISYCFFFWRLLLNFLPDLKWDQINWLFASFHCCPWISFVKNSPIAFEIPPVEDNWLGLSNHCHFVCFRQRFYNDIGLVHFAFMVVACCSGPWTNLPLSLFGLVDSIKLGLMPRHRYPGSVHDFVFSHFGSEVRDISIWSITDWGPGPLLGQGLQFWKDFLQF